jgi:proline dehydrogenase
MDYGVEGKSNEEEFERTTANFLETIRFVANKPNIPFISLKVTAFSRFGLLEKNTCRRAFNWRRTGRIQPG